MFFKTVNQATQLNRTIDKTINPTIDLPIDSTINLSWKLLTVSLFLARWFDAVERPTFSITPSSDKSSNDSHSTRLDGTALSNQETE